MGQKTHPHGFRLGITTRWRSNWYAEKDFAELLKEDLMLRRYVGQRLQRVTPQGRFQFIALVDLESNLGAVDIYDSDCAFSNVQDIANRQV